MSDVLDFVPPQALILALLLRWAIPPARYIVDHIRHDPSRRDITQPPVDLSWRSGRRLAGMAFTLLALVAAARFIVTPSAEALARSAFFLPAMLSALGAFALHAAGHAVLTGHATPIIRGLSDSFSRDEQPKRFWAALAGNGLLGVTCLALAPQAYADGKRQDCLSGTGAGSEVLEACSALLDDDDLAPGDRVDALVMRGRHFAEAGEYEQAMLDYDRAVRIDNTDADAFYYRGLLRYQRKDMQRAMEDLTSAVLLDPDHVGALTERGSLKLDDGDAAGAKRDLDRAIAQDNTDARRLALRGFAHIMLGETSAAERDLDAADAIHPGYPVVARGRVILAATRGNVEEVRRLTGPMRDADPDDPFVEWAVSAARARRVAAQP